MKKPVAPAKKVRPVEQAAMPAKPQVQNDPQRTTLKTAAAYKLNVAFAQVITMMMRHQAFRTHFIAELEWMLVPPIATGQFLISEIKDPAEGIPIPVAAVLWARVSAEVDKRLSATKARPKLSPTEWSSGTIPWLVDALGDPKETAVLIKHLAEKVFAAEGLKTIERQPDGSVITRVLGRKPS